MQREIDLLDMEAIFIISAGEQWHRLASGRDSRNAFVNTRRENKEVTGTPLALWVQNEVVAQRLIAQALKRFEIDGVRVDRRWVAADAARIEKVIFALAAWLGCKVMTDADRLREAKRRADARADRAGA